MDALCSVSFFLHLSLAAWQGLVASHETGYTQADVLSLQREGKCKTGTWDLALELEA